MTINPISRGTSVSYDITVRNSDGSLFDLAGYTMYFTVKDDPEQQDSAARIGPLSAEIDSPSTGLGKISLTSELTNIPINTYWYNIEITNGTNVFKIVPSNKGFEITY